MNLIHEGPPRCDRRLPSRLRDGVPHTVRIFEDPDEREIHDAHTRMRRGEWDIADIPVLAEPTEYLPPISLYRVRVMELLDRLDQLPLDKDPE